MQTYRIMDLFAGVGGLSYGFSHHPAFQVLAANEIEPAIATAYSLNYPEVTMLNCDIAALTEEALSNALGGQRVDVVVGGPPCQSYSTLGKRRLDNRAVLFQEYRRILQILQPRAFVFENVLGILSMDRGQLFRHVQATFEALGYDLKYQILDAVNYGVPQRRERVILVGMRGQNNFEYPAPTHGPGLEPYVTLEEAIGDLPPLKSGQRSEQYLPAPDSTFLRFVRPTDAEIVTEHSAPQNGAHLIRLMEALGDGQGKDDLPPELRPKSGYGNTYAKLWWKRPSTTITRNFACPSSSRCIHPRDSRAMTIREGARLQSFPDDYRFYGSDSMKRLEIGNAVPPLLSIAIARQLQLALDASTEQR
jgi:DNA (cytosine-5)-methyltransferase 1